MTEMLLQDSLQLDQSRADKETLQIDMDWVTCISIDMGVPVNGYHVRYCR